MDLQMSGESVPLTRVVHESTVFKIQILEPEMKNEEQSQALLLNGGKKNKLKNSQF